MQNQSCTSDEQDFSMMSSDNNGLFNEADVQSDLSDSTLPQQFNILRQKVDVRKSLCQLLYVNAKPKKLDALRQSLTDTLKLSDSFLERNLPEE